MLVPLLDALVSAASRREALALVTRDQRDDPVGDQRPQRSRQVVAHPVELEQLGAGDRGGGRPAAAHPHQRVVGAVDQQRRQSELPEARRAVTRGEDGEELPGDAGGVVRAIERAAGALEQRRLPPLPWGGGGPPGGGGRGP